MHGRLHVVVIRSGRRHIGRGRDILFTRAHLIDVIRRVGNQALRSRRLISPSDSLRRSRNRSSPKNSGIAIGSSWNH
jgi:hypothetical protein